MHLLRGRSAGAVWGDLALRRFNDWRDLTIGVRPSAVPAADLRFGGVLGPFRLPRAAGGFPNAASELAGSTTERRGASSLLQCVRGVFVVDSDAKRRKNSVFGALAPSGGRHK
jgi:hypothetical protein